MLGKAEEQYNDLLRKKSTVETDKVKIYKVIEELENKKKAEVRAAWIKVNKDFGSIFSTLLPGTMAKLQPPEGQDVLGKHLDFVKDMMLSTQCGNFRIYLSLRC